MNDILHDGNVDLPANFLSSEILRCQWHRILRLSSHRTGHQSLPSHIKLDLVHNLVHLIHLFIRPGRLDAKNVLHKYAVDK